jgi:hypothetical protein
MKQQTVLFLLIMFLLATSLVSAQSTPTPAAPYPIWQGQLIIRPDLSFAWVRREPSSTSENSETLLAGTRVIAFTPTDGRAGMIYDGVQWWGYVRAPGSVGWVELASLVLVDPNPINPFAPTATPAPGTSYSPQRWASGNVVRVRASVPFVYVRTHPGSSQVAGTVLTGGRFVVLGDAIRDESIPTTFWRQVREAANNGLTVGWVEEASLEFVRARANFRLPPLPSDVWRVGFTMRIRSSLPFAWIRDTYGSNANILYTLRPGDEVVLNINIPNDGVQNWRPVTVRNTNIRGYVEESALEFVRVYTYP